MTNRTSENQPSMSYPHLPQSLSPSTAYSNPGSANHRQHLHRQWAPVPFLPVHGPTQLRRHSDSKQLQLPHLEHAQMPDARRASYMPSSVSTPTDMPRAGLYHHHLLTPGSSPQDSSSNSGHSCQMPHSKSSSQSSRHSFNYGVPEASPGHSAKPQYLLNGQKLPDPRASLLHPHARHLDHCPRSVIEPNNLLGSVPTRLAARPLSMSAGPHRIVTGILESALPLSSRPVPVVTTPTRHMTIQELEERHKLALQKLQTQGIRAVAKDQATVKQVPTTKSAKLAPPQRSSSTRPGPSTLASVEKPTMLDRPTKVAKPAKEEKPAQEDKSAKADKTSKRKSIFGFFGCKDSGSSRAAQVKAPKTEPKEAEAGRSAQESDDDDDEDVPLAQLRRANCAARPSKPPQSPSARRPPLSHLAAPGQPDMSMSASGQRRPLSHRSTRSNSVGMFGPIPEDPSQAPGPARSPHSLVRPLSHLSHEITGEDFPSSMSHHLPGMVAGPGSSGAAGMARGPRPAILEAEEKARRNSRRAVAGLSGVDPQMLEGHSQLQQNHLSASQPSSGDTVAPGGLVKNKLDKWIRY